MMRATRGVLGLGLRIGLVAVAVAAAAATTVALSAGSARAQQEGGERLAPSDPGAASSSWYGWQILFTDGAAVSLLAIGVNDYAGVPLAIASGVAYLGGGPVVHGLHERGIAAGESFLLRLGLPSITALVGGVGAWALSGGCGAGGCTLSPSVGAGGGALFGVAAASVIDIAVLAHEPRQSGREPANSTTLTLHPVPLLIREAGRPDASGFGVLGVF